MTTSAARPSDQAISRTGLYYDPDDALPKGSPLMKTVMPVFSLAPGPQLTTPRRVDNTRPDGALIANLDSFRGTPLAQDIMSKRRGEGPLEPSTVADSQSPCSSPAHSPPPRPSEPQFPHLNRRGAPVPASLDLKILAADALAFTSQSGTQMPTVAHVGSTQGGPDTTCARTALDLGPSALAIRGNDPRAFGKEERTSVLAAPAPVHSSEKDHYHGRPPATLMRPADQASPTSPQQPSSGGLPPLQIDSPRSDSSAHGQALPSIRQHFSDLQLSPDNELPGLRHTGSFSRSPPSSLPNISSMANFASHHATSPISPNNGFRPPDLPSPQALSAPGYGFHTFGSVAPTRPPGGDHSSGTADTPSSDQSSTAPAADRLDGLTISSQQGGYICTFSGCTAAPFQTQYLLNSHANVHSSARPHYCPVIGCSRSEGGKGFKRKNEMIRHGLVHESPGYVCPFCPDREHKYPRPDNLQRHVRVHHMDKDKDDPALRDVLSQRPDGPNRGRRRRGAAS